MFLLARSLWSADRHLGINSKTFRTDLKSNVFTQSGEPVAFFTSEGCGDQVTEFILEGERHLEIKKNSRHLRWESEYEVKLKNWPWSQWNGEAGLKDEMVDSCSLFPCKVAIVLSDFLSGWIVKSWDHAAEKRRSFSSPWLCWICKPAVHLFPYFSSLWICAYVIFIDPSIYIKNKD